jgi:glycosyltransferase involved in cell wall biosynthesis
LVKITGPVEDALEWLGRARIAIVPIFRGAGVSVKIAEAWRAGCAVVSTPVGARGYHALEAMVVETSAASLARAILAVLEDPQRRERLALAGRQHFEEHYSWPAVFARLDQRLAEVVTV